MKQIFDFRFAGKKSMPVKLPPDGRKIELILPSKGMLEMIREQITDFLPRLDAATTVDEVNAVTDLMYDITAAILSSNKNDESFNAAKLKKMEFNLEAMAVFLVAWSEFAVEVETSKN